MTVRPGEEFRNIATPSQELLRRLAYLATQDSESVLTGGIRSIRHAFRSADSRQATTSAEILLQLTRLADPAYQAVSARINEKLDQMDEASVMALQDIERELLKLRRERERMLEQAYRDEQGRLVFMTEDGTTAYYEDGTELDDDEFVHRRDQLQGRTSWNAWQSNRQEEDALKAERDLIHRHETARAELRDALAQGSISQEEAEGRERELEEALPERVLDHYRRLRRESPDPATDASANAEPDLTISAEEEARHNVGLSGPGFTLG